MRPITSRSIILALSVIATACSGDISSPSLSPTSASLVKANGAANGAQPVPFRGSITTADQAVIAPPFLLATGTGEGTATHLGRFTATYEATANLATSAATGTYRFTAANGDLLVATFVGSAVAIEPGLERFTEVLTIVSGTGRFAAANGTITLVRLVSINYAAGTSTATGSMEGEITLK
jgi:hypothetical protein